MNASALMAAAAEAARQHLADLVADGHDLDPLTRVIVVASYKAGFIDARAGAKP